MFLLGTILLIIVFAETCYILLGKENLKRILQNGLEDLSGGREIDFSHGLYTTEANDFTKCLKEFFQSVTLSNYKVNSGWLDITYSIGGCRVEDREAVKRAICIELHSYLLNNHGVDFWSYYIPVLTNDTVMIRIAASPAAEREYSNLRFSEKLIPETPLDED